MAENKKGFVLYADLLHTVSKLPHEKAGELFKHILEYVNDNNPITDDLVINIAFEPIKQQLKRDLEKYYETCNRNKINGSKGGRPKNPTEPKKPSGLIINPTKPKKPDTDNDSDTDSDTDKEIKLNISFDVFWDLYDKKVGNIKKIEPKWNKLTNDQRTEIVLHIPKYKLSQPNKKYRKNPEVYINNESWKDEIIGEIESEVSETFNLTEYLIPNNDAFGLDNEELIKRCKEGYYKKAF